MKNTIFEQAALEAGAGLKELDAQFDQLEAKKEELLAHRDLLESVGRHLFTVISMAPNGTTDHAAHTDHTEYAAEPAVAVEAHDAIHEAAPAPEERVPFSFVDVHPEETDEHVPVEETASAAEETADAPATEPPTFAELLSQTKPYSLRNDGWPAATPVASRTLRSLL
jgi:hypothetical protein